MEFLEFALESILEFVLEMILKLATEYRWLKLFLIMLLVVAILGIGLYLMFG